LQSAAASASSDVLGRGGVLRVANPRSATGRFGPSLPTPARLRNWGSNQPARALEFQKELDVDLVLGTVGGLLGGEEMEARALPHHIWWGKAAALP